MRHLLPSRLASLVLFSIVFVAANGCGRSVGSLGGSVSYKGEKLKGGSISFISTEGFPSAAATIQPDGTYRVPQLTAGIYTVTVDTESLNTAGKSTNAMAMMPTPGMPKPAGQPKAKELPKNAPPKGLDQQSGALATGYQMGDPNEAAKRYVKIPARYAKQDQSKLSFTADGSTQSWDIPLTD